MKTFRCNNRREIIQRLNQFRENYYKEKKDQEENPLDANENTLETAGVKMNSRELLDWALKRGYNLEYNAKYNKFSATEVLRDNSNLL